MGKNVVFLQGLGVKFLFGIIFGGMIFWGDGGRCFKGFPFLYAGFFGGR